ncbi:MAG: response regulator transcription factor [Bacteriovorax sp.]|nr:response regulator transcription factor [Bacteriovorax sp.]
MNRILYIDDNIINLNIFKEKFSDVFDITVSINPVNVFNLLEGQKFDAILLDIHMPDRDGFQVLKEISESRFSNIPVLMYTSDELQVIRYKALASQAADIIYRTLTDKEIELRIFNKINLFAKRNVEDKHLTLGSLRLNLETLEAFHQELNLNLTPIEFKILSTLIKSYPEKISRDVMVKKAWNQNNVLDRTVNTHLTNLRNKLPKLEFIIESPRATGIILKKVTPKENTEPTPIQPIKHEPILRRAYNEISN